MTPAAEVADRTIEAVGKKLRDMMAWLKKK